MHVATAAGSSGVGMVTSGFVPVPAPYHIAPVVVNVPQSLFPPPPPLPPPPAYQPPNVTLDELHAEVKYIKSELEQEKTRRRKVEEELEQEKHFTDNLAESLRLHFEREVHILVNDAKRQAMSDFRREMHEVTNELRENQESREEERKQEINTLKTDIATVRSDLAGAKLQINNLNRTWLPHSNT